jgi:hypothetical protein
MRSDQIFGSQSLDTKEHELSENAADPPEWEYFVTPLMLHSEAQILNNWGAQGWELVQIITGPEGGNVAYLKRRKS